MLYSCAYFRHARTIRSKWRNWKNRHGVPQAADQQPGDRVLEIGCGWGSFAIHAARNYGAHVTAVTISPAQYDCATERLQRTDV